MQSELEQRLAELSDEIRRYPTPIARCDEQLTDLIERRARLIEQLKRTSTHPGGCSPLAIWLNDGGFDAA